MRQMQTVYREHIRPFVLTCSLAGVVLSVLAPYGTINFSWAYRLLFWIGLCMAGGLGAGGVAYLTRARNFGPLVNALCQSLGATLCVSVFVIGLNYGENGSVTLIQVAYTLFYIWVIAITLSLIGNYLGRAQAAHAAPESKRPVLYDRIKPRLRSADVYALSSEDHYVRLHTSAGDDLILMRLTDAIREISPLPGLRTHRSWWVAESGVDKLSRDNGKLSIQLKNGLTAPVSRARAKDIREAGWG